jgi:hypothetical protein
MGRSMSSQPQKIQGLQKKFFHNRLCKAFFLIILVKKTSQLVNFFSCYCQNTVKIMLTSFANLIAWFFSILALALPIIEAFQKVFLSK